MKAFSQKGFSLPEVLVGVALTGVIGLLAAQLLRNQTTSNKTAEIKSEYDEVTAELRQVLSGRDSCTTTFVGRNATVPAAGNVASIKYVYDRTKPPLDKFLPNTPLGFGLLQINRYSFSVVSFPADSKIGVINLRLHFRFDGRKKGGRDVIRDIKLNVETNSIADRRIRFCSADSTFVGFDDRYLRITGGTMKGNIVMSDGTEIVFESDKNLKTNIDKINSALPILRKVNPVSYKWSESGKFSYGFIAQNLETILPDLVTETERNYLGVDYMQFTPLLIAGIKDVHAENERLRNKIKELKEEQFKIKRAICLKDKKAPFCGSIK